MAFAIYVLSTNLATYLFRPEQVGGQNIVIPLIVGVTIRLDHLPYLFIAFAIVLITHEGLHGVIARRGAAPVKSAGIFLVLLCRAVLWSRTSRPSRQLLPGQG
jgi:hypothetical protein